MVASSPLLLTGPADIPSSPTHALVCLHGFGADGTDFIGLATPLRSILTAPWASKLGVFCPHGPSPTPNGLGRQWFRDMGWTFRDREGIQTTGTLLWEYLQTLHTTHAIPYANMALLGFSQGGMQALYSAPRGPHAIGALIAHSACLMWQEELNPATCQKPPTLLLHGYEDDMVPADQTVNAATGLEKLGFPVEKHILPGLGHGLNAQSLAYISVFLSETLPNK